MGWWGENLFQSDQDYDIIGELSEEAGVELFFFEKKEDRATATKTLDDGKFNELFDKIKAKPSSDYDFVPAKYELVILTALAMQLGAKIDTKKRKHVQRIYKHTGQLMGGAVKQMQKALKEYEDGTPWDFEDSLGLLDTANMRMEESAAAKAGDGDGGKGKAKKGLGEDGGDGEENKGDEGAKKEDRGFEMINVQPPHLAGLHEAVREALQKTGWPS